MHIEHYLGTLKPTLEDLKKFKDISNETIFLEFKGEVTDNNKQILRIVGSFANTLGGLLVLGIDDKTHDVIGVKLKADTIEDLLNGYIEPSLSGLYYLFEVKVDDEKYVQLIEVGSSPYIHAIKEKGKNDNKYYSYYVRTGPSTRKMDPTELNRIASLKSNYNYNLEYRIRKFKIMNTFLSEILSEVNIDRNKEMSSNDLFIFADLFSKNKSEKEFSDLFDTSTLESMYEKYYQSSIKLYIELWKVRYIPHTNLTYNEDYLTIDLLNSLKFAFNLSMENVDLNLLEMIEFVHPRISEFSELEPPLTAMSFISMMLEYAINDNEKHKNLLEKFDKFIWQNISNNNSKTIIKFNELQNIFQNFFKGDIGKQQGVNELFRKYKLRYEQYLHSFCSKMSDLIVTVTHLRDSIYESLMLPVPIDSIDHQLLETREDYWFY